MFKSSEKLKCCLFHDHEAGAWKYKCIFFFKNQFFLLPNIVQKNVLHSNDDQGRVNQSCKFHDPKGRGSCAGAI